MGRPQRLAEGEPHLERCAAATPILDLGQPRLAEPYLRAQGVLCQPPAPTTAPDLAAQHPRRIGRPGDPLKPMCGAPDARHIGQNDQTSLSEA
jgi:hypothetical protein